MSRRLRWAVALSVVVHAAFVFWWQSTSRAPTAESEQPVAVELNFLPEPDAPRHEIVRIPDAPRQPPKQRRAVAPPNPIRSNSIEAVEESLGEGVTAAAPAENSARGDGPRAVTLVPREVVPRVEEPPRGRTVHNRPGELPDPAAVLAYEGEVVKNRVDGWVQTTLARTRVENGVVSYYFHDLRKRLELKTDNPPPFVEPFGLNSLPQLGQQVMQGWSAGAKRYGKTGAAYEETPGYKGLHGAAYSEAEKGGRQAREFQQKTEAAARLRDFGDGKMGEELLAVVELRQGSDGALVDLSLIQPSSSVRFDAWVMQQAPKAVEGLVAPPDAGVGIHPDGMHSVWAFKGRVTYKRDLGDAKLLEDGWYVGLMAVPALLTGNFDEVTGKVEYVDLRHPKYECRVQLLEVY